jgi:hypothetical protein
LRTKDVADLTWEFVATTLIDESETRSMRTTNADTDGDVRHGRGRRSKNSFKHNNSNRTGFTDKNVFCSPDQCSITNTYVDDNSFLISE